ncbi:hypothetical protein GBA52_008568 [Prunus armeniaca]|nr:hypothetical protein GBA52_008568 [Prunus armeniaca]
MVRENKKLVEEVSGWLRVFDDGSVDRTWTGPPEVKFMVEPVAPHNEFIDGVATKDVIVDEPSGLRVRIYLPEQKPEGHGRHQASHNPPLPWGWLLHKPS